MISKIGDTIVSGNLDIISSNTEINSDDINIKNNIIILNSKETSNKVSNNIAGLEINRRTSAKYQIVYDEQDQELKSGLSNNLKPISNEEYAHDNINNAKTNLNTQIYKNDFLNELPKIGYYQEDTVQITAKYNLNNANSGPFFTVDGLNREIMYFLANDGSADSGNEYKLFYGYRTNDSSNFVFVNEYIIPKCLGDINFSNIVGLDNSWIILKTTDNKFYLIDTNLDTNGDNWTSYKNITSIIKSESNLTIKYFPAYQTIAIIYTISYNVKSQYFAKLLIYRYDNLSLINEYQLENPSYYLSGDDTRFLNTQDNNKKLLSESNLNTSVDYWCTYKFLIFEDVSLLEYVTGGICLTYIDTAKTKHRKTNACKKMLWNVPKSIYEGKGGNISLLTTTPTSVFDGYGFGLPDWNNMYHQYISYDSINKKVYMNSYTRDSFEMRMYRFNSINQKNSDNILTWGTIIDTEARGSMCQPSDASVWGKQIKKGFNMWDVFILDGRSQLYGVSTQKWFNVKQWQKYKGQSNTNIIEPKPGGYSINTNIQSSPYFAARFNGFTTNKMSDGSATYYACANYNNTTGMVNLYKYIRDSDASKNDEAFATHHELQKSVNVGNLEYWRQAIFHGLVKSVKINGIYYNPNGDYFIVLVKDNTTYTSDSSQIKSYSGKFFFGVVKSDGSKVIFDYGVEDSKMGKWAELNNSYNSWSYTLVTYMNQQTWTCLDKYTILTCLEYSLSNGAYGGYYTKLKFADDNFSSFSNTTTSAFGCYSYSDNIDRPINIYYSGPKYGLMCSGNGWIKYPMAFRTQYPIIDGEGKRYTEDGFINDMSNNSNLYYMYLQSSQGLIAYVPSIPIFLGGYFEVIQNPIAVNLQPNTNNYIYLERDSSTKKLKAYASTTKDIEEGSKQFSRILLARVLTNEANPIETEYYRINTGYNDYTFYHKITIKQTPNQTIHVYTTENGKEIDHTSSFFVKINSNIKYRIEIKPDLWCAAGTLQNISSNGIIDKNLIVSATPAKLISTNYSYTFKMEYVSSINPPIYRFGNNYSATYPDGQNYSGNITPIDQLGIYTNLDSVIHYQYSKPLPDGIKSVFIKLVCKDGEHFLGHFMRDEFDQYGDVYHSKVLGTQENLDLFKRLYDTKEVFTCVTGIET